LAKEVDPGRLKAPALGRFRATFGLAALLVLAYFALSQGNLFIEKSLLEAFSFSALRPLNIVFYMFTHMSVWHLAVNVAALLFFAAIVETRLSWKDVFGTFFFSGVLTVLFFLALYPNVSLVGASAGVWGIMASAFVLDVRKALLGFGVIVVVVLIVFPLGEFAVLGRQAQLEGTISELEAVRRAAAESGNTEAAARAAGEKAAAQESAQKLLESKKFASEAVVDPFLHSYAAFFGILYLLVFRRAGMMKLIKEQKLPFFPGKRA